MQLPFQGIKVLDLSRVWAIPGTGMYLADQGADVVKVEPLRGDDGRRMFSLPAIKGESRGFWMLNRNKRSLALDPRSEEGKDILLKLIAQSDVLLHNFRPGVAEKMGIGYDQLKEAHPSLVYLAFSPYGGKGPLASARGYDLLIQATSGISGRRQMPDGTPRSSGIWAVDLASSALMAYALSVALFQRERTGKGQKVEGSLMQTALALQTVEMVKAMEHPDPEGEPDFASQAVFGCYACSDEKFLQVVVTNDGEWKNLCEGLGREDLQADSRFATTQARMENSDRLKEILTVILAGQTQQEWQDIFAQADAPAMGVLSPGEVFHSPQAEANDFFVTVDQPGIGQVEMINIPFSLSQNKNHTFRPAPGLGEHSEEILRELGIDDEKITAMKEKGVVA